jgi:nucleoside phosphorylase/CheY-like chemotaxis protein
MLRVLVVEDDSEKLRRVLECIERVSGCEAEGIDDARDIAGAKVLLRKNQYDLMILDITLPERVDQSPVPEGGISLLDEVLERDIYNTPQHIVGLTAYDEIFETAGRRFADDLWLVIKYDPSSEEWADRLQRKIHHILLAARAPGSSQDYRSDLCIFTALAAPELEAVLQLPWNWRSCEVPNDPTIYHRGEYQRDGKDRVAFAAAAPRMGMTAAAVLAMKMIIAFRPRYVAAVGILAGIKDACALGDVIAADPCWDWGSGKRYLKDGLSIFSAAPHQISVNSSIRSKLALMAQDRALLDEIRRAWRGPEPVTSLRLLIGPVASGASVLQDPELTENIKTQHRKLIGIDMETYGIFAAADESPLPTITSVTPRTQVRAACKSSLSVSYKTQLALACLNNTKDSLPHMVSRPRE